MKPSLARTALAVGLLVAAMAGTAACGGQRKDDSKDTGASDITCDVKNDTRIGIATGNTTGSRRCCSSGSRNTRVKYRFSPDGL